MKFKKHFKLGDKWIGEGEPCFVTAEIGLNHNGNVDLAEKLIRKAKECGSDAVKFQKRDVNAIFTKDGLNQPYHSEYSFGQTYGEHRKNLELSEADYYHLKLNVADEIGIIFYASAWDKNSADFLEKLNVPAYKIASADVTNLPLVEHIARKGKPVIMSTGMSSLSEVEEAVNIIRQYNTELVLLHCISTYPSRFEELNLKVMDRLIELANCLVGYSSHDLSICISEVVPSLGACMIEKHFTLDRAMKGPDHAASLEPQGLYRLVRDIRDIEASMGEGSKKILKREVRIREKLAKSIVASRNIKRGETITRSLICLKSPALGFPARHIPSFIGRKAKKHISKDEYLTEDNVDLPTIGKAWGNFAE